MHRSPGYYRRLAVVILQTIWARTGIALLVLVGVTSAGLPLLLAVGLAVATFAGLWLATSSSGSADTGRGEAGRPSRAERKAFDESVTLQSDLRRFAQRVEDEVVVEQLGVIDVLIAKILAAIAEDGKYQAAAPLLDLIRLTHDLLAKYVKVVGRDMGEAGTHLRIQWNLEDLKASYEIFWRRLNRDAIVDLEALSETIGFVLQEVGTSPPSPAMTPEQPAATGTNSAEPTDIAVPTVPEEVAEAEFPTGRDRAAAAGVSARELEVICLVAEGLTDQEIGDSLYIARRTVTSHLQNTYSKLNVSSRTAAAVYAVRREWC